MSEPAKARRFFTGRRVAAAMAALLFLALAWVCVDVWRAERRSPYQISVAGFELAPEGTSMVAVMTFTNRSYRTFSLTELGTSGRCRSRFFGASWPTNMDEWNAPSVPTRGFRDIPPDAGWRFTVNLPQDGRTGRVGLWLGERVPRAKRLRARLAEWLSRRKGAAVDDMVVLTEEFIQCPRVRPDGTLDPAHILPKGDGTR